MKFAVSQRLALIAGAVTTSIGLLAGCAATATAPAPAPAPATASAPAPVAMLFASVDKSTSSTVQGGALEAFAYSEKAGDAVLEKFVVADGATRVTGSLGARSGSTWGGLALLVASGPGDKTVNLSSQRTLNIQLASPTATQLRVRILGNDKKIRDSGCYPVVMQKVTPAMQSYAIPLSGFAPETYCAAQGRTITDTAPAVGAVEVSDPTVSATPRPVDFKVGRIEFLR